MTEAGLDGILLGYERAIHTVIFFAAISCVALWEEFLPRRRHTDLLRRRWRVEGWSTLLLCRTRV